MSGPPQDVPPDELWLELLKPRPSVVIDFPRVTSDGKRVGQCRIQVLPDDVHDEARINAHLKLKRKLERMGQKLGPEDLSSPALKEVIGDLVAKELLQRATLSTKPMPGTEDSETPRYPYLFPDADDIGKMLSADELLVLFNAYLLTQNKFGPFPRALTEDDVDAWICRLQEGADRFPLLHLSLPQLAELTCALSARLYSLSRILRSFPPSTLPDSLASLLEGFSLATYFAGEPLDNAIPGYSAKSDDDVSTDRAVDMSERQKSERS